MKLNAAWIVAVAFSALSTAAVAAAGYSSSDAATGSGETPSPGTSMRDEIAGVPSFTEADRNGDGAIDWFEASDVPGLNLSAADRDTDGVITMGEYNSAMGLSVERGRDTGG